MIIYKKWKWSKNGRFAETVSTWEGYFLFGIFPLIMWRMEKNKRYK